MPKLPQPPAARANIYDVAKLAGVSHMTVSRVLNDHPNVRASTRERVDHAIRELQYQPSTSARALASRRTMRIGALVDNPVEYGPGSMLRAFESAAREAGYSVGSITAASDDTNIDLAVESLIAQDVDGLCVIAPRVSSVLTLRERGMGVPTIALVPQAVDGVISAAVDQYVGARLAVEHLLRLGHTSVAHLAGPLDWYDARYRKQAWAETLEWRGLTPGCWGEGDWTAEFGYHWASEVELDGATAVFAANDQMALGVLHGLTVRGLRVPHDVSVVGFDDVPDSQHYLPPLTTVRQDFSALGDLALQLLVAEIEGRSPQTVSMIAPELVERESTAPPQM